MERIISFEYANEVVDSETCSIDDRSYTKIKSRGVFSGFEKLQLPALIDGNIFYNAPPGSPQAVAQGGAAAGSKKNAPQEQSFWQKYKWYIIIGVIVYFGMQILNNPDLKAKMEEAQRQAQAQTAR